MSAIKKVLVIGAGASGLAAIKCCMDIGLDIACVERSSLIGGMWHYTPEFTVTQAYVVKSTTNNSKELMGYSDFLIPRHYANYMHHTKVLEYLHLYAERFNLRESIRFRTDVIRVEKAADFKVTGRWEVKVKDLQASTITMETYDAVMVCTGHHAGKHIPEFPGLNEFQGKVVHASEYKDHITCEEKRVVVVGIGNSGVDVSTDLSSISEQVFLSAWQGEFCISKVSEGGLPVQVNNIHQSLGWVSITLPTTWVNAFEKRKLQSRFDHALYTIKPKHRYPSAHPSGNDKPCQTTICGRVIVKPNIRRFTKTGIEFEDGTFADDVDVVILATGYLISYPFIGQDVIRVKQHHAALYKSVFPPDLEYPTLAIIGCTQFREAIMSVSELQSRWVAMLWQGKADLPQKSEMWNDIHVKGEKMANCYVPNPRAIQVDLMSSMDELAELIGCKPSLTLFLSDPMLAWACFFGPITPMHYRLMGPNHWSGARSAVLSTLDQVPAPQQNDYPEGNATTSNCGAFVVLRIALVVLIGFCIACIFL